MAILSRLATSKIYSDPIDPDSPTEAELADLCQFVQHLALAFHKRNVTSRGTADFAEFQDAGMTGLEYAWRTWHPGIGIPFTACAKSNIFRRTLNASRDYHAWCFPGSSVRWQRLDRCKPQAEHLRPPTWYEVAQRDDLIDAFHSAVQQHRACFTHQGWQALQDVLDEQSYQEIAARDHITAKNARLRVERMLRFLRSHVFGHETSCVTEQRLRAHYPGHGRRVVASLAAAD